MMLMKKTSCRRGYIMIGTGIGFAAWILLGSVLWLAAFTLIAGGLGYLLCREE